MTRRINVYIFYIIIISLSIIMCQSKTQEKEKQNNKEENDISTEKQNNEIETVDENYKEDGSIFEIKLDDNNTLVIRNLLHQAELYLEKENEKPIKISNNILNNVLNKPNLLVSFDRKKIAYLEDTSEIKKDSESFRFDLYVYNIEKNEKLLVESNVSEWYYTYFQASLAWSPNSKYLLYRLYNTYSVINVYSGEIILVELGVSPVWSEDGEKIAFIQIDPIEFSDYLVYYDDGIKIYSKVLSVYDLENKTYFKFTELGKDLFYEEIKKWDKEKINVNVIKFNGDVKTIIKGYNHDSRVLEKIEKRFIFTYIYNEKDVVEKVNN